MKKNNKVPRRKATFIHDNASTFISQPGWVLITAFLTKERQTPGLREKPHRESRKWVDLRIRPEQGAQIAGNQPTNLPPHLPPPPPPAASAKPRPLPGGSPDTAPGTGASPEYPGKEGALPRPVPARTVHAGEGQRLRPQLLLHGQLQVELDVVHAGDELLHGGGRGAAAAGRKGSYGGGGGGSGRAGPGCPGPARSAPRRQLLRRGRRRRQLLAAPRRLPAECRESPPTPPPSGHRAPTPLRQSERVGPRRPRPFRPRRPRPFRPRRRRC